MSTILLPSRGLKNKLIFVREEDGYLIYQLDTEVKLDGQSVYRTILNNEGIIEVIDPDSGPFMPLGYEIQGLKLAKIEQSGLLYFRKMKQSNTLNYKIGSISDLHGNLIEIDPCKVFCICGDIVPLLIQANYNKSEEWFVTQFFPWINSLPCERVIFIGGNHDFYLEKTGYNRMRDLLNEYTNGKGIYLEDSGLIYDGIYFYGSPRVEHLSGWAFNSEDLHEFNNIPDCDILLTHTPPRVNDVGYSPYFKQNWGCQKLADIIGNRKIKYALSGHVHEGNHSFNEYKGTQVANVSYKNEFYIPYYPVLYVTL
jgi:predicted phosphohydrolase